MAMVGWIYIYQNWSINGNNANANIDANVNVNANDAIIYANASYF